MSDSPTLVRFVNDRKSISNQVRGASGAMVAENAEAVFEQVEIPVWLHGLVGIDFSTSASIDPFERLAGLLTTASTQARK